MYVRMYVHIHTYTYIIIHSFICNTTAACIHTYVTLTFKYVICSIVTIIKMHTYVDLSFKPR